MARQKVLLLDDDPDVTELYREMLGQLPSNPEVHTATSGARAIALLESETFNLLISDLNMPKMDGLQVLTIVRRKCPQLRTVAMTAVLDEQFRSRAYAMGVDLFLEKPSSQNDVKNFLDCIESLLGREESGGFRGVQSKSLVDLIQLECLSQSSSVLKVTNGGLVGKIWIQTGEIIDAEHDDVKGEQAFQKILSWKQGNFEILPADPARPRAIFNSYQGLLLETAQAIDEAEAGPEAAGVPAADGAPPRKGDDLQDLSRFPGVEFVLITGSEPGAEPKSWGLENKDEVGNFTRQTLQRLRALGDKLNFGQVNSVEGYGLQRHFALVCHNNEQLCVGFKRTLKPEQVQESVRKIISKWAS